MNTINIKKFKIPGILALISISIGNSAVAFESFTYTPATSVTEETMGKSVVASPGSVLTRPLPITSNLMGLPAQRDENVSFIPTTPKTTLAPSSGVVVDASADTP